jgi:hypothetical protein
MKKVLLLTAVLALPLASQASVLTFDDLDINSFSSITTDGYTVNASTDGIDFVTPGGATYCGPACVYNGTNYLMGWLGGSFTLSKTDGSAFSIFGFDGAETHTERESSWAQSILLTGTKSDGSSVSQSFALDFINDGEGPLNDFQTFSLSSSFTNLVSLHFEGIGGQEWFSVDNVQTSQVSVPESSSLLLMLLGLVGLGASRRKLS